MNNIKSIGEVIYNHAKTQPDKLCLVDDKKEYTYKQVWNYSVNVYAHLEQIGLVEKDIVMVHCTQDVDFLILFFACNLGGYIFVPVEKAASRQRVEEIIVDTGAKLYITEEGNSYGIRTESFQIDALEEKKDYTIDFKSLDTTSEILYTTGTTGKSKGIEISNQNNIALAENVMYGTEMKPENVEIIPLPLSHSHALRCCYANFLNGSTIIVMDGIMNIKRLFSAIDTYKVTALDLSPSALKIILRLTKRKLNDYKDMIDYIQIGTAFLGEYEKESLKELLPNTRLYNFYGSTESGRTCAYNFNTPIKRENCIGLPTKNAKVVVVDENRQIILSSKENMGLIATAGKMNMKGYWRQEELTASIMEGKYIYSNDWGYIDAEGYVYVIGRIDDIINYKGIKIAPSEIEQVVFRYAGILDCACVGIKDKLSGEYPKLFVVVEDKEDFSISKFMNYLNDNIDSNKVPKEVEIIDAIPHTSNGKIHRIKLKELEEAE